MHAVVELDRVPSRREGKADHAERVGADLHAFAVDRRAPAAVVRLANDEAASGIPGLDAPATKTSGGAVGARRLGGRAHVALERRPVDAVRGRPQLDRGRDDRARITRERDLIDANATLVEDHRERAVELGRIREVVENVARGRRGHDEITDR